MCVQVLGTHTFADTLKPRPEAADGLLDLRAAQPSLLQVRYLGPYLRPYLDPM